MKHYQITEELFFMLARYQLLGQEEEREEIETLLQRKVDAMINPACIPNIRQQLTWQSRKRQGRNT